MTDLPRRSLIAGTVAAGAGLIAPHAGAQPAAAPKTPFSVAPTFIPIAGSDEMFLVRRIYCIGRNYAAHAREMGSDPDREPPFFFQKPTDAIRYDLERRGIDPGIPTQSNRKVQGSIDKIAYANAQPHRAFLQ